MTAQPDQIRRDIERTRAHLSNDVDALAYKASPTRMVEERKQRISGALRNVRETVMGASDQASSGISDATGRVGETISDAAHSLGETASEAPAAIRRQAQGNPLAAGLIAFGVGWLVSSIIPPSETERQAMAQAKEAIGEHGQQIKDELTSAAKDLTDNLREPAQQAMAAVQSSANDAAGSVKDDATTAARTVGEQTQR